MVASIGRNNRGYLLSPRCQGHCDYPFEPQYQHACSPYCSPYISYGISWENLNKRQEILSLVIISFILMTCTFDEE